MPHQCGDFVNAGGGILVVIDFIPLNKQSKLLNVKYIWNSYFTAVVDESEEWSLQEIYCYDHPFKLLKFQIHNPIQATIVPITHDKLKSVNWSAIYNDQIAQSS